MRFSVKERILIHLMELGSNVEGLEISEEATQVGLAEATGIQLRHVSQYLRPLLKEGLVVEHKAHIKGVRQRRRAYALSDAGKMAGIRIRRKAEVELVRVREAGVQREATVSEVLGIVKGTSLLRIAREAEKREPIDLVRLALPPRPAFVEMLSDAPQAKTFVGRKEELRLLTSDSESGRLIVVQGIAGIGKTWLAAQVCVRLRGTRNLFWHRVRPWDTRESILAALGEFLAATGKPGLRAVLHRGEVAKAGQVLREDLPGTLAFLVFDDAHEANGATLQSFRLLVEAITDAPDVRALILTRNALPFYGRRDVVLSAIVKEIDLRGLQSGEVATYLFASGVESKTLSAAKGLQGHPLFLELIRARRAPPSSVLQDVRRYMEEEIYSTLSTPEREMMKVASLYRVPVPREALFADPHWSGDVLLSLVDRSLLRRVGENRYEVHDVIREYFVSLLTPAEASTFGAFAIRRLQELADEATAEEDFLGGGGYLSNALQLSTSQSERRGLWEGLGDVNRRIGDVLAVSVAFRSAMKLAADQETLARLHRKMASALYDWGDARSASQEVEAGFRALGDLVSLERGWLSLMRCRVDKTLVGADIRDALQSGEEAVRTFEPSGELSGLAQAFLELATIEAVVGAMRQGRSLAETHFRAALEISESLGDPEVARRIHLAMARDSMYRAGDANEAMRHLAAIQALPGGVQDLQTRARFFLERARVQCFARADFSAAAQDLAEALRVARLIRDESVMAVAPYISSFVSFCGGATDLAGIGFEESAREQLRLGSLGGVFVSLYMAAICSLIQGDFEEFRRILAEFGNPNLTSTASWLRTYEDVLRAIDFFIQRDPQWEMVFGDALRMGKTMPSGSYDFIIITPRIHVAYGVVLGVLDRGDEADAQIQHALDLLRSRNLLGMLAATRVTADRLGDGLRQLFGMRH